MIVRRSLPDWRVGIMKRLACWLFWSTQAGAQQAPASGPAPQMARVQRVEQDVAAIPMGYGEQSRHYDLLGLMKVLGVPGLSVAVFDRGKVLWARGYGVTEAGGR